MSLPEAGAEALVSLLLPTLAVFAGCAAGILLLAFLGCALLCGKPNERKAKE